MRQIAWYTLLVLITVTGLLLLWQFRQALFLFLFSLVVSSAFHPLINYLTQHRMPRKVAFIMSYVAVFGVLAVTLWLMSASLIREVEQLSNQVAVSYEQIHTGWQENGTTFQKTITGLIPPPHQLFVRIGDQAGIQLFQGLVAITSNLASFFGSLGLVLVLSLYWSADRLHFERLLLSLIPVGQLPLPNYCQNFLFPTRIPESPSDTRSFPEKGNIPHDKKDVSSDRRSRGMKLNEGGE